jgi:hypothetical protein
VLFGAVRAAVRWVVRPGGGKVRARGLVPLLRVQRAPAIGSEGGGSDGVIVGVWKLVVACG